MRIVVQDLHFHPLRLHSRAEGMDCFGLHHQELLPGCRGQVWDCTTPELGVVRFPVCPGLAQQECL